MTRSLALLVILALSTPLAAQRPRLAGSALCTPGRMLVSGFFSDAVHFFRTCDGAPRGSASAPGAQSIVLGRDGLLYACAEEADEVVRIDPDTRSLVDVFVGDDPLTPDDENGPLDGPTAAVFGPGGDLFVASFDTDQILRFDGATGAYEGIFVTANLGGLNGPDAGTKFGRDGFLYVPSFFNDRVLRYDSTGAFVDAFVAFGEGGLRQPRDLVFHKDHWYVASSFNNRILRYDADGNFVDVFALVGQPYSLAFHPVDHELYVVSRTTDSVHVLDGETGAPLRVLVPSGTGGLSGAVYVFFLP